MNLSDLFVIGVIAGFALIGYKNGFIFSIFRLVSYFVSVILAVKLSPVVSGILIKTPIFATIKESIYKNLMLQHQAQAPGMNKQVKETVAQSIIENLHLPGFLKDNLAAHLPDPSKLIDVSKIMDFISTELAKMVIDVMSLVLLYVAIRIAMVFLRFILQGISKLPVFKQVDKLGGVAFGGVEGLLTIYIAFALLMLFNANPQFKGIFESIESSTVAKFFYQNNFIIQWLFPGPK